ncbi:MAG: STAS domain-containing protein [Stagnimonas sp.]|nr:STAS domain-containing protein [Stagnimonas sp.]
MRLEGELSLKTVPLRLAEADAIVAAGQLDLSGISQADSAGLAFLLELTRRARAAGTPLRLLNPPPQLASLVHFFDLDTMLSLPGTP